MFIFLTLLASVASAVLYRMGGSGKYNTQVRDIGCSLINTLVLGMWLGWHWPLILTFFINWGTLTTYWDFVNKILPVKDKDKEYWWNWALHGFFNSFAAFPLALWLNLLPWLIVKSLLCALMTMLVSILSDKDTVEEYGRGAAMPLSNLLAATL